MTTLPVANRFTDGALTNAQAKAAQNDMLAAIREMPGGEAVTTLTIAAGVIVPTRAVHLVDTEAAAATDDLDRISNVNHPDGRIIILSTVDQARDVTVKHGLATSGTNLRILLNGNADLVLADPSMRLVLQRRGTDWVEIDRVYGTQTSAARQQLRVGGPQTDVASAATVDLGAQVSTNLRLTGSTAVTSFGSTASSGETYTVRIAGSITITHNATSLICPGGRSLDLQDGDTIQVQALGSGNWAVIEVQLDAPPASVWKAPVVAWSTTNVNVSSPGTTIDGVTMAAGDRVGLGAQTAPAEQGIWIWNGSAVPMTRARDANVWADLVDAIVPVTRGTNGDRIYRCTVDPGGTLGTTAVTWTQVGALAGLEWISGAAISGTPATVDITIPATGEDFILRFEKLVPATDDAYLMARYSNNGGSSYSTTDYKTAQYRWASGVASNSNTTDSITLTWPVAGYGVSNVASEGGARGELEFSPGGGSVWANCQAQTSYFGATNAVSCGTMIAGQMNSTATRADRLRLLWSTGNFATSGRWDLYRVNRG